MAHLLLHRMRNFTLIVLCVLSLSCTLLTTAPTPIPPNTPVTPIIPTPTPLSTPVPTITPTVIASNFTKYNDYYFSLVYDNTFWEDKPWTLPSPEITLPALQHRSLANCRIGFRRGGWSGGFYEMEKIETQVQLGDLNFHIMTLLDVSNDYIIGTYYTAYEPETGELYLPLGVDFWLGSGNVETTCIQDIERVLTTLRAASNVIP